MTLEELNRVKDISCDFARFLSEETVDYLPNVRILSDTDEEMTLEELFDYFVHTMFTEIETDKLNPNDK